MAKRPWFLIALAVALVGCSSGKPHHPSLNPQRASELALRLANEKAQAVYNVQPFLAGPSAQLVQGRWVWNERRGLGFSDIEAIVTFAPDGSEPIVSVVLLDSRLGMPRELRR